MFAMALSVRYPLILETIEQHLNARGSKPDDYKYMQSEGETTYVVRMCQEIADKHDIPYEEVRKLETYCSGHSDYSHKFALYLSQIVPQGEENDS